MDAKTAAELLDVAEKTAPAYRGDGAKAAFEQIEQRYGDLTSALRWFLDQDRTDDALRLAISLTHFWFVTKRLEEGCAWFERAIESSRAGDAHRGRALFDAGYLYFWKGDDNRSSELQYLAVETGRRDKDPTVIALALVGLARIALRTNVEEARRLCREALAETEGTSDRLGRSSAMHVLAVAAQMAGDFQEAREIMRARIALGREMGNLAIVSIECGNLSMVERQLGNLDEAEALASEALEIDYRRRDEAAIPWKVNGLAAVARDRGNFERAAKLIGVADATMKAAGGAWPPDELVHYQKTVETLTSAMGPAEFERARAEGLSMTTDDAVSFALKTGRAK